MRMMTSTQSLIAELATAHGVDAETIIQAAITDFAHGRSHNAQAQILRTVAKFDAAHDDDRNAVRT